MKKTILLFIATLLWFNIFSQTNFQPSYVVDWSGNKIEGFIDYKNWDINPETIFFKKQLINAPIEYTPLDIKEFFVLNDLYLSASVEIDLSSLKTDELTVNPNPELVKRNVFLQSLYKGEKNLLYYMDENRKAHFFIKNDKNEFVYLLYRPYYNYINGTNNKVIAKNQKYKGILILYLDDCPKIKSQINNLNYNKESFNKLFKNYSACTNDKFEFIKNEESIKIELGAKIGIIKTKLNFKVDMFLGSYNPIVAIDDKTSFNFSYGLFANFLIPRNFYRLSFYTELFYSQYYAEGIDHYNEDITRYIKFGPKYVELVGMLRYRYPGEKSFVYINGGFSGDYLISCKKEYRIESDNYGTIYGVFPEVKKLTYGICLGTGIKFNRFSTEVRYRFDIGIDIIQNYTVKSNINQLSFLIGYTF